MANYAGSAIIGLQLQDQTKSGLGKLRPTFSRAGQTSGKAFSQGLNNAIDSSLGRTQDRLRNIMSSASSLTSSNPTRVLNEAVKLGQNFADSLSKGISQGLKNNQKSFGKMLSDSLASPVQNGSIIQRITSPIKELSKKGGSGNLQDTIQTLLLGGMAGRRLTSLSKNNRARGLNQSTIHVMQSALVPLKVGDTGWFKSNSAFWKDARAGYAYTNPSQVRAERDAWKQYRNLKWYQKPFASIDMAKAAHQGAQLQAYHFGFHSAIKASKAVETYPGPGLYKPGVTNADFKKNEAERMRYLSDLADYRRQRTAEKEINRGMYSWYQQSVADKNKQAKKDYERELRVYNAQRDSALKNFTSTTEQHARRQEAIARGLESNYQRALTEYNRRVAEASPLKPMDGNKVLKAPVRQSFQAVPPPSMETFGLRVENGRYVYGKGAPSVPAYERVKPYAEWVRDHNVSKLTRPNRSDYNFVPGLKYVSEASKLNKSSSLWNMASVFGAKSQSVNETFNPVTLSRVGALARNLGIAAEATSLGGAVGGAIVSLKGFQMALSLASGALKTFAVAEKSMNETVAILASAGKLGLTEGFNKEDAVKSLKEAVYEAASKSVLNAGEIADIANQFSRAGRSREEIEKALTPTANFAVASGLSSIDSSSLLADIQMAYGFDVREMGYVSDKLMSAIAGSNMNAQQLQEALKASVAVAKSAGVSFDDLLKSIMQLADVNIKGGMANTVLRNVYMREGANKNAKSTLGRLGFSYDDVQGLDILSYVEKVSRKMLSLGWSREDRLKGYSDLFGMYGISAGSLFDQNIDYDTRAKKYNDAMANFYGTTSNVANSKMEGWVGSMERFKAQLDVCKTIIGDIFGSKLSKWTQQIVQTDLPRYFKRVEEASDSLANKMGNGRVDDFVRGVFTVDKPKISDKLIAGAPAATLAQLSSFVGPGFAATAVAGLGYNALAKIGASEEIKWSTEDIRNIESDLSDVMYNLRNSLERLNPEISNEGDYQNQRELIAAFRDTLSMSTATAQEGLLRIKTFVEAGNEMTPELRILENMFRSNSYSCGEMSRIVEESSNALEKNIESIRKEEEARNRATQAIEEQSEEDKASMQAGWDELSRWSEENRPRSTPEKYDLSTPSSYKGYSPEDWQNGAAEAYYARPDVRAEAFASEAGEKFFDSLNDRMVNMMTPEDWQNGGAEKYYAEQKSKKAKDDELDYRRKLNRLEKRSAREMKEMAKQYQKDADDAEIRHQEELATIKADNAENISGSLGSLGDLIGSNFGFVSNKEWKKAQVEYETGTPVSSADVRGMLRDYGTADPRKVARMQTMENLQDMMMAKQQQEQMWYEYLDAITQGGITNKLDIDSIITREMNLDASNATFTIDKFSVGESLRMAVGKIEGGVNIPEVDNVSFGEGDADSLDTLNSIVDVITEFKDNSQKYFDEQSKPVQV